MAGAERAPDGEGGEVFLIEDIPCPQRELPAIGGGTYVHVKVHEAIAIDQRVRRVVRIVVAARSEGVLNPTTAPEISRQSTGVLASHIARPAGRGGDWFAGEIAACRNTSPFCAAGSAVERGIRGLVIRDGGIEVQAVQNGPAYFDLGAARACGFGIGQIG